MEHKDLFSGHAKLYASFRPSYPGEMFEYIFSHRSQRHSAWDCGTGNGQVATELAKYFDHVFATDISAKQIDEATKLPNIYYSVQPAEQTSFPDNTFDLITVAQALHWIDREKFYNEARRVAKPNTIIAVWGYSILSINDELDKHILHFYREIVGPYWDNARKLVDDEYQTISFPFEEITTPRFHIKVSWNLNHLAGYLETWSSTQKYIREHGENPVDALIEELKIHWRDPEEIKTISFPVFLRMGKVIK